MRVLIVDDEEPARSRLRQMLASHQDLTIAGEAETGPQAMELAVRLKPDLMLLDIQMPGCSGIDVAACLPEPRPRIIFCTAFDRHAVDAFELNAVDYLLKPISRVRLAEALARARSLVAGIGRAALDVAARSLVSGPARFLARRGNHYVVIGEAHVLCFASDGGLTRIVCDDTEYWMDPTLNELEGRLDPGRFFRISRAAIINLNAVLEIHPMPGGSGEVLMKGGRHLEVSRRRFHALLEHMAG